MRATMSIKEFGNNSSHLAIARIATRILLSSKEDFDSFCDYDCYLNTVLDFSCKVLDDPGKKKTEPIAKLWFNDVYLDEHVPVGHIYLEVPND